jgi:hypothetical protein
LRDHFQFLGRCSAAAAHARAAIVVSPEPLRGVILGLLDAFDDVLVQPIMPYSAVVARDVGVLLGLPRLDMQDGNPLFNRPFHQLFTDVFRTVINPNGAWLPGTPGSECDCRSCHDSSGLSRQGHDPAARIDHLMPRAFQKQSS